MLRGAIPEEEEKPPALWFQETGTGTAVEGGEGALTSLPRSSVRYTRGKAAPGVDGSERGSGGLLGSLLGRVLAGSLDEARVEGVVRQEEQGGWVEAFATVKCDNDALYNALSTVCAYCEENLVTS